MKKILWISDYSFSGYTLVTSCLLPYIQDTYDIYILVINNQDSRHSIIQHINTSLNISSDHVFTLDKNVQYDVNIHEYYMNYICGVFNIPNILKTIQPDIILSINDLQILTLQMHAIKACSNWNGKTIAYIPVDAENYKTNFFQSLMLYDYIITMNENSKKIIQQTGLKKKIYVLPHPIKSTFIPLSDKNVLRSQFFNTIIDKDDIVIINANINSVRKRLDITIESFYSLHHKHNIPTILGSKKLFLILKTSVLQCNDGLDIHKYITTMNKKYNMHLDNRIIIITEKYSYEDLNKLYNCANMYITTTSGEGWGLTAFEFIKLNIYTIVPDNISYTNYFNRELLCPVTETTLCEGRKQITIPEQNIYNICLQGVRHYTSTINIQKNISLISDAEQYILSPSHHTSLVILLHQLKTKYIHGELPDIFEIHLELDIEQNWTFVETIMYELSIIDFTTFFKDYSIIHIPFNNYDHFITKVKLVNIDHLVDKILYYITNQNECDTNIKAYSKQILKGLSDDDIGHRCKDILQDMFT